MLPENKDAQRRRHPVRWNFFLNLFDGSFFAFAMSLVSLTTVMPVLVKKVGGSNIAVGLIPVLWIVGFNIPQILVAGYANHLVYVKRFMLKTAFIQRLPWLGLGLLILFVITHVSSGVGLVIILTGLLLAAVGGSFNLPAWFELVAKVTPVELRGKLFASRSIFGALMGIGGGGIVSHVLAKYTYPLNYALLFFLAFMIMMVSYIFLVLLREEKSEKVRTTESRLVYLKRLFDIMRENENFRHFLIADAMMISALMADAFYTVNAMARFSLEEAVAGRFIMIMMVTMIVGNLFFGHLADRFGHKRNLQRAAGMTLLVCILAISAPVLELYYLVFAGAALTVSLIHVSRLAIIAEICGERDRPVYVALTNMITAPFILFGVLAGWLADLFGYDIVFMLAGSFALMSFIGWWRFVREPRTLDSAK